MDFQQFDDVYDPQPIASLFAPQRPCPCGSRRLFRVCCSGRKGRITKAPYQLPSGNPEQMNPKCYLNFLGGCVSKMTGEHLVSKSIGKDLPPGGAWFAGKEVPLLKPLAVEAKILCKHHNEMLSPFDSVGLAVHQAIIKACSGERGSLIVSGYDFERFLLQRLCAHYYGKALSVNGKVPEGGFSLSQQSIQDGYLNNTYEGGGLHMTMPPEHTHNTRAGFYEFAPVLNETGRKVVGCRFTMFPFSFVLMLETATYSTAGQILPHIGALVVDTKADPNRYVIAFAWDAGDSDGIILRERIQ